MLEAIDCYDNKKAWKMIQAGRQGNPSPMNLDDILIAGQYVTQVQLAEARQQAQAEGGRIDRKLIELGHIEEEALLRIASEQLHIPMEDLAGIEIERETLNTIPSRVVHQKKLMPIARYNGTLRVATSDPYDLYSFDELRMLTGLHIEPVLAPEYQIHNLIKSHYGVGGDTINELMGEDIDAIIETNGAAFRPHWRQTVCGRIRSCISSILGDCDVDYSDTCLAQEEVPADLAGVDLRVGGTCGCSLRPNELRHWLHAAPKPITVCVCLNHNANSAMNQVLSFGKPSGSVNSSRPRRHPQDPDADRCYWTQHRSVPQATRTGDTNSRDPSAPSNECNQAAEDQGRSG